MPWRFGDDDFERRSNMTFDEVAAVGRGVRLPEDDMAVDSR